MKDYKTFLSDLNYYYARLLQELAYRTGGAFGKPAGAIVLLTNRCNARCVHCRMVSVKDYDLFLEIASEIRKQNDKVRFSILGDGPLKDHLKNRAKELGIDDCVEFMTPVPDPFPYYNSLDIYMNTSFHEGLPVSILEAMSCGKPVIAPRVGGIPEILTNRKDAFLIDNREPHNFAHACISILENGNMRNSIANNNLKRIQNVFSNS